MKNGIRAWKIIANHSLRRKYGLPIMSTLLLFVLNMLCSEFTYRLFPGDDALSIIASQIFAFILSILVVLLSTGIGRIYLNISRQKQATMSDFIYYFKNQPDRILLAGFVFAAIEYIVTLPANYYAFVQVPGDTMESLTKWMYTLALLSLGGMIVNLLLTLPIKLTLFLLVDNPKMGSLEAMKCSIQMMKGHMGQYLLMIISFIPWMLFCLYLTVGLGLLWLMPYMKMTEVTFYRNLRGELDGYYTNYHEGTPGQ